MSHRTYKCLENIKIWLNIRIDIQKHKWFSQFNCRLMHLHQKSYTIIDFVFLMDTVMVLFARNFNSGSDDSWSRHCSVAHPVILPHFYLSHNYLSNSSLNIVWNIHTISHAIRLQYLLLSFLENIDSLKEHLAYILH